MHGLSGRVWLRRLLTKAFLFPRGRGAALEDRREDGERRERPVKKESQREENAYFVHTGSCSLPSGPWTWGTGGSGGTWATRAAVHSEGEACSSTTRGTFLCAVSHDAKDKAGAAAAVRPQVVGFRRGARQCWRRGGLQRTQGRAWKPLLATTAVGCGDRSLGGKPLSPEVVARLEAQDMLVLGLGDPDERRHCPSSSGTGTMVRQCSGHAPSPCKPLGWGVGVGIWRAAICGRPRTTLAMADPSAFRDWKLPSVSVASGESLGTEAASGVAFWLVLILARTHARTRAGGRAGWMEFPIEGPR